MSRSSQEAVRVGLFGRGKRSADPGDDPGTTTDRVGTGEGRSASTLTQRERGPWDVDEVTERGRRVDLGALWLPPREGMELRMEVEKTSKVISAAAVTLKGSALQLQVFAAPRTE